MQQVGGITPLDLPVDQAGAIVDEPVVHVVVPDILHLDQETVAGWSLADDIEGCAFLFFADDGNLVGEVLDGDDILLKDVVEEFDEDLFMAEDELESEVYLQVHEDGKLCIVHVAFWLFVLHGVSNLIHKGRKKEPFTKSGKRLSSKNGLAGPWRAGPAPAKAV